MNNSKLLSQLFRQKSRLKKQRDKHCRQFYYHVILPWPIWGVGFLLNSFVDLVFGLDWKKGSILSFLNIAVLFVIITGIWGIFLANKIWKLSQKLAKIDQQIIEELEKS